MNQNVQINEQNAIDAFKQVYNSALIEAKLRRKTAGVTQKFLADWLKVDRREIIKLESGKIKLGLLIRYGQIFDIDFTLKLTKH